VAKRLIGTNCDSGKRRVCSCTLNDKTASGAIVFRKDDTSFEMYASMRDTVPAQRRLGVRPPIPCAKHRRCKEQEGQDAGGGRGCAVRFGTEVATIDFVLPGSVMDCDVAAGDNVVAEERESLQRLRDGLRRRCLAGDSVVAGALSTDGLRWKRVKALKGVRREGENCTGTRTICSQSGEVSVGRKAWVWVARRLHVETRGLGGEVDAEEAAGGGRQEQIAACHHSGG
jgi:hypothetical protein